MAFGQAAGPPAPARQIDELAALLERAGFSSFREARHPYGLNQRQATGKFTAAEATELIERLQAAETVQQAEPSDAVPPAPDGPSQATDAKPPASKGPGARRRTQTLSSIDAAVLAGELERRGWCCIPPPDGTD